MYSRFNKLIDDAVLQRAILNIGVLLKKYQLVLDSRLVNNESIFCAYQGSHIDSNNFIADALRLGAKLIISDKPYSELCSHYNLNINLNNKEHIYYINNLAQYLGLLASYQYNCPSAKLHICGITGTNGKTSITYWLNQIYQVFNIKSGLIGTIGCGIYPQLTTSTLTTPNAITLQKLFANFVIQDVKAVTMEVSSHALHQGRVNGIKFNSVIFTNLTQDHLDYHHTMEEYYRIKASLFAWHQLKNIIINIDDIYGARLYQECLNNADSNNSGDGRNDDSNYNNIKIITYGLRCGDVYASNIIKTLEGVNFTLHYNCQKYENLHANIVGEFNLYNLLAVIGYFLINDYLIDDVIKTLSYIRPVIGRMETYKLPNKPLIVVDYAHTPDALKNVLITLTDIKHSGNIYCVFGCGGNRDITKRALMGDIAHNYANYVIVTDDNPRDENSIDIINNIIINITHSNKLSVIQDRKKAIAYAISLANNNDIVLIAGKGHEIYQETHGVKHSFSDMQIAKQILEPI